MHRALSLFIYFFSVVLFYYCFLSQSYFIQIKHLYFLLLSITQNLKDKRCHNRTTGYQRSSLLFGDTASMWKTNVKLCSEKLIWYQILEHIFFFFHKSNDTSGIQVSQFKNYRTSLSSGNRKDIQKWEAEVWGFLFCLVLLWFLFSGCETDLRQIFDRD